MKKNLYALYAFMIGIGIFLGLTIGILLEVSGISYWYRRHFAKTSRLDELLKGQRSELVLMRYETMHQIDEILR